MPELSGLHFQRVASNMFKSFCYRQSVAPFNIIQPCLSVDRGHARLKPSRWVGWMDGPKSGDHQLIGVPFECFFHGGDWKAFLLLSSLLLSIPIFGYHHFNFSRKRLAAIFLNIKSLSASMFFVDKQLYWILSAACSVCLCQTLCSQVPAPAWPAKTGRTIAGGRNRPDRGIQSGHPDSWL